MSRRGRSLLAASLILAGSLAAPGGCVVDTRQHEVVPLRMARGPLRYTWNPLGDLVEALVLPIALPFVILLSPLMILSGDLEAEDALFFLTLFPGFVSTNTAFKSDLAPDEGFSTPLQGPLAEVVAELASREKRTVVVAPEHAQVHIRLLTGDDLRQLVRTYSCELTDLDPDGAAQELVFRQEPRAVPQVGVPGFLEDLHTQYATADLVTAPSGRGVLVCPGRSGFEPMRERLLAVRRRIPARRECRGPLTTLHARGEPLSEVVERLAGHDRPVTLQGDPGQRVWLHLADVPWEQAVALLAIATGRDARGTAGGGVVLVAPGPEVTGWVRGARPADALELVARAAGLRLEQVEPPAGRTTLQVQSVPAPDALWVVAELLGVDLEARAGRLGVRSVRPAARALSQSARPRRTPRVEAPRGEAAPVNRFIEDLLRRALEGEEVVQAGQWAGRFYELLARGGAPAHLALEARLAAWPSAWFPALRAELRSLAAQVRVDAELDRLRAALERRSPWEVLEAVPELQALAIRLRGANPAAASELIAEARELADQAVAWTVLLARSDARLEGILIGPELELALIDGRVVAPREPLPDRAGAPRRDVEVLAVQPTSVVLRSGERVLLLEADERAR